MPGPSGNKQKGGTSSTKGKNPLSAKNVQEGDESDAASNNDVGDYEQDPQERREIRQQYRHLMEVVDENEHDLVLQDCEGLLDVTDKADHIFKSVTRPREAAMDAQLMVKITHMTKKKAQNLQSGLLEFVPRSFAEKLVTYLNSELEEEQAKATNCNKITWEAWKSLGAAVQPFFRRSPPVHLMNGSFNNVEKKTERKRRERITDDNTADKRTVPTQLLSCKDIENHETTTDDVKAVLARLQDLYDDFGQDPIDYFEFVTNPFSFGQTIENIFYTSFLAKDGHVKIYLDDDKLPVIEPVLSSADGRNDERNRNVARQQVVTTFSRAEWKEIIEVCNIETPIIPTRAPRKDGKQKKSN